MKNKIYYKSILQNSTIVIKISGKVINDKKNIINIVEDIKEIISNIKQLKIVVIFGLGYQLDNYILSNFNKKSIKHNGRRVTNNNEINAIKRISGEILLDLYSIFSKNNINSFPIPISRKDLIIASKRPITKGVNYGSVGDVESIDNIHFQNYFENHDLIIMPSLVLDKNTSEILNINADTIATEVAVAIKANKLIFISDVEYIADNEGKRISVINESDLNKLIKNKTIKDGMVVKVENIFRALKKGIEKVHMICGTKKNCLLNELNTEEGVGTEFKKNYVEY
tara:strand:- start:59 stop:907 length:849 start_codon:yes stop_codon:yes gene_type:complete